MTMQSFSQPRTLVLTERRPHIVRLAPADVAYLLEHHRGRVELLPTGRRDRYRLTALGCVGVLAAPTCRLVIRPKVPLVNVFAMLDPLVHIPETTDRIAPAIGTEALDFLAASLAQRMRERIAAGLHRAYRVRNEQGSVLHGRLDLSTQLREAPGRKEQLHSQYEEWSDDVPCNQVVKATAESLLTSSLPGFEVRAALRQALAGFVHVSSVPRSPQLWQECERERQSADYRQLLDLCRLLAESMNPTDSAGSVAAPSFLLDLERAFERYVARGVVEAFAGSRDYTIGVQRTHFVNQSVADQPDVTMRPDLTIDRDGRPILVIDTKWKKWTGIAETAELYQVLAYGTALGARGAALVYPGKRWRCQEYRFLQTPLRLMICTLNVGGKREACVRSVRRLTRMLTSLV